MRLCLAPPYKVRYPTEQEAQAALVGAVIARNRGRGQRQERRLYQCRTCNGWHLTHQEYAP